MTTDSASQDAPVASKPTGRAKATKVAKATKATAGETAGPTKVAKKVAKKATKAAKATKKATEAAAGGTATPAKATKKATKATKAATAPVPTEDGGDAAGLAPESRAASPRRRATAKRVPAEPGSTDAVPSRGAGDGDAPVTPTTRTRTRSRSATPAAAAASDAPAPREGSRTRRATGGVEEDAAARELDRPAGEDGDGADGSEAGQRTGASGRRRRRGGRGRRGRGGAGTGGAAAVGERPSSDDRDDDRSDVDDDREADSADGRDGEPRAARGSTRIAAKKARRSSGGRSGGSNGSGDGGQGGGARRRERPGGVTEEERRAILAGPPRTMLVTARPERTQIAVMEDRTLVEHYVTRDEDVTFVGNIYMGRVQNVLPGMEAAFVDIGKGRNGVLYAGEVLYDELDLEEESDQRIENVLKPGKKVLVQVTKDPMGTKGPRLTMHLSLAGRYVVLAPNSSLFGISRKLTDEERDRLRRIVKAAKPDGHGVIVRTAAEGATEEQLTADVRRLVERWDRVEAAASRAKPLEAVYEEPKLVVKVIRDIFGPDFERCIVDDESLFEQVRDYLDEVAPELVERVELYGAPTTDARSQAAGAPVLVTVGDRQEPEEPEERQDAEGPEVGGPTEVGDGRIGDSLAPAPEPVPEPVLEPVAVERAQPAPVAAVVADARTPEQRRRDLPQLFTAFDVTDQLRQAMNRKVWLPSGGYLIIEATEAMKVIDVNTGRFTGGSDSNLEEVVLKTNLEAAEEIVRQLRLRDMGGMIIIDFIDMLLRSNQEQVVRRLKRELLRDRTKTRVSDVSRLGLVQMTRKNVSQGLVESFSTTCESCDGHGFVTHLT